MANPKHLSFYYRTPSAVHHLIDEFLDLLVDAYKEGYTVVTLSRTLNFDAYSVHRALQVKGVIPEGKSGKPRSVLPDILTNLFQGIKLSFPRWCSGHGLDLQVAGEALSRLGVVPEPGSVGIEVHERFRLDFPFLYAELFEGSETRGKKADLWGRELESQTRYDINFAWQVNTEHPERSTYLISSPQLPDRKLYAQDALVGLKLFNHAVQYKIRIEKLRELLLAE